MRTGRPTLSIVLTTEEREQLEAIGRRAKAPQAEARRARVILGFAEGLNNKQVCAKTGLCAHTVGRLRKRFHTARLAGLNSPVSPKWSLYICHLSSSMSLAIAILQPAFSRPIRMRPMPA